MVSPQYGQFLVLKDEILAIILAVSFILNAATTPEKLEQWKVNARYPEQTIRRAMELHVGVMNANTTVAEAIEQLRQAVPKAFITYLYGADA